MGKTVLNYTLKSVKFKHCFTPTRVSISELMHMEFQSEVSLCIILHEVVYLYFFMIFYFKDVTYCVVIMDIAKWHNKRV